MTKLQVRVLIYIAVAVVCSLVGVFAGLMAGVLTFLQIAAVVEALFWFGLPKPAPSRHRQHRILFNG